MSDQLKAIRATNQLQLQTYRERYERLVAEGKHAQAATVRGQITRQCGKLDGIDQVLEVIK